MDTTVIDNIIKIEDDPELYNFSFKYKNTLMYPFVRFLLIQKATLDIFNIDMSLIKEKKNSFHLLNYICKSWLYYPYNPKQSDLLFWSSDIANIKLPNGYFNRICDSLANEYINQSSIIESADQQSYKRPRIFPRVFSQDFIYIKNHIKTFFSKRNLDDIQMIEFFMGYLKEKFPHKFSSNEIWLEIEKRLVYYSLKLKLLDEEYQSILKKINPKIIFIDAGCYGGDKAPIIMAARELKIPTVEWQHGIFSLSHPAYNYHENISERYKYYLPDYVLFYGDYWLNRSRIPATKLSIGNPYLEDTASKYTTLTKKKQLLYASPASNFDQVIQSVLYLHEKLYPLGITVLFRPHPIESASIDMYKPLVDSGIELDMSVLYDTLAETKYVVGETSTILFEAVSFDCIVFMEDSSFTQTYVDVSSFNSFVHVSEIVKMIENNSFKKHNRSEFMLSNWRNNFRNFIQQFL